MKILRIYRKRWARGRRGGSYRLLNEEGKMCCLGFDCRRRGFKPKEILDVRLPYDLVGPVQLLAFLSKDKLADSRRRLKGLVGGKNNSRICSDLAFANDDPAIDEEEREQKITQLFKKLGILVKFIGKG